MTNYINTIGLNIIGVAHNEIVPQAERWNPPALSGMEIEALYAYPVPEITTKGCGLKAKEPYRLEQTLELKNQDLTTHPNTVRLQRLNQIVERLQALTAVDWLGIYRRTKNLSGEEVLLKESYYGRFSRAEFPLTSAFAKNSNNSVVGLSGKAVVVQSVEAYEGPYYACDIAVQSEFCLPILDADGDVLGIIDAEAFTPDFFTNEKLLEITKVAQDLGKSELLGFSVDENNKIGVHCE